MKEIKDLVSIITPAYNTGKYIGLTIESVIAQTYSYWELVIVDDGSKDDTLEAILKYCKTDSRIKLFRHPGNKNKGVSASRNLAIQKSSGQYIALLDSDDLWVPYKLEIQLEQIKKNSGVEFVFGKVLCIDENGHFLRDTNKYNFPPQLYSGVPGLSTNQEQQFIQMLESKLYMPCATVLFTRKILGDLLFYEGLHYQIEDHFLFTLLVAKCFIYNYDAPLAYYRLHPTSYTATTNWIVSESEFLEKIKPLINVKYHGKIDFELKKRKNDYQPSLLKKIKYKLNKYIK